MGKRETSMTEGFWLSQAPGLFIAESPLVHRAVDRGARLVDGLILPDEPKAVVSGVITLPSRANVSLLFKQSPAVWECI